ncbi:MAG: diguanylate cyclase [Peptostreptococcaceae bacterium]|jgi:diguanylate cyclase (GGDEF)-like protein|nr:diguanylate cyclase [Peptostreptococcaceae bacterium]
MFNYYNEEMLEDLYDGVVVIDKYKNIVYWNNGAKRITGLEKKDVINKKIEDNILIHMDKNGKILNENKNPLQLCMDSRQNLSDNYILKTYKDKKFKVKSKIFPLINKGNYIVGALEIFKNLDEEILSKAQIMELKRLGSLDDLTGFYNRTYGDEIIRENLLLSRKNLKEFSLLLVEISNLYDLHSMYKKGIKEKILKAVSDLLKENIDNVEIIIKWSEEKIMIVVPEIKKPICLMLENKVKTALSSYDFIFMNEKIKFKIRTSHYIPEKIESFESIIKKLELNLING